MRIEAPEINPTLTPTQVAEFGILGTSSVQVVLRYIRQGKIGALKVGKEYRIPASEIKEYNRNYTVKRRKTLDK